MVLSPATGAPCSALLDSATKSTQFLSLSVSGPITQALGILRTTQKENLPGLFIAALVLDQGHGLDLLLGNGFHSLLSCGWRERRMRGLQLTGIEPDLKTCTAWCDQLIPTQLGCQTHHMTDIHHQVQH